MGAVQSDHDAGRYALTSRRPSNARPSSLVKRLRSPVMLLTTPARRRTRGLASIDARTARFLAGGLLGVAALRPMMGVDLTPTCPLRSITGVPCPLCGTARGVDALVHGDLGRALVLNPGVLLLAAATLFLMVQWRMPRVTVPVRTIAGVLAVLWIWQLAGFSTA